MADIGPITNTLRGIRDRGAQLAAEALEDLQRQIVGVYNDIGFSLNLVAGHIGILIGAIQTNLLEIIGDTGFTHLRIFPGRDLSDDVRVELSQGKIFDIAGNLDFLIRVNPHSIQIEDPAGVTFFFVDSQKSGADYQTQMYLVDPTGPFISKFVDKTKVTLDMFFAAIAAQFLVDSTQAKLTLTDATRTSILDHKSIVTPRGRIGSGSAPASDGFFTVASWVGIATAAQVGSNVLDVAGASKFTGEIEGAGGLKLSALAASLPLKLNSSKQAVAAAIDLASSTEVTNELPVTKGGTGANTAGGARTNLSVYSIADVDLLISNLQTQINGKATAGVQTGNTGGHTHTQLL